MHRWSPMLVVALAVSCARPVPPSPAPATAASGPITISIIATTDLHGHVESVPWLSVVAMMEMVRGPLAAVAGVCDGGTGRAQDTARATTSMGVQRCIGKL